jgi:hypothetical protein
MRICDGTRHSFFRGSADSDPTDRSNGYADFDADGNASGNRRRDCPGGEHCSISDVQAYGYGGLEDRDLHHRLRQQCITVEVGSSLVEQELAVETHEGLVVVTGCAHPSIVDMVRQAREAVDGELALVMGGFHLGGASPGQIERIIADLRGLG